MSARDPVSPCSAVCLLDPATDWCRGCFRTIDEIAAWAGLAAEAKRRILDEAARRRQAAEKDGGTI